MEAIPRSLRKMRKHLSAPGLLGLVRTCFERVKDPCVGSNFQRFFNYMPVT